MVPGTLFETLSQRGSLYVHPSCVPLTDDAFQKLALIATTLSYRPNVKRLPNGGIARSQRVLLTAANECDEWQPGIDECTSIFRDSRLYALFAAALNREQFVVARCQINRMQAGDRMDPHKHRAAEISAVLSLKKAKIGGNHFVRWEREQHEIDLPEKSLLISRCDVEHGVTLVEQGERIAVVWMLK